MEKRETKSTPPEAKYGNFTKAGDVWSIGAIAFNLLSSDISPVPFFDRLNFDIENELQHRNGDRISKEARDFVMRCLKLNPRERMLSSELMDHPWLQTIPEKPIKSKLLDGLIQRLYAFQEQPMFRRLACRELTQQVLHRINTEQYRMLFDAMDEKRTGVITHQDFFRALRGRVQETDLIKLFFVADFAKMGVIEFDSFLGLSLPFEDLLEIPEIIEGFYCLDMDGDGWISANDLSRKLGRDEAWCERVLADALPEPQPREGEEKSTPKSNQSE